MKELQTLSVVSPGFFGLNTQESGITLSSNFAQLTDNVVIDKYGRLGSRKGWQMRTSDGVDLLEGEPITFLVEHFTAANVAVTLSGGNNKLFKNGDNSSLLVDVTPAAYTITANNWKGASLFDHTIMVQVDHEPVIYTEGATPATQTITTLTGVAQSFGTSYPRDVIAAYGRFWAHDGDTVYWSTDIADAAFPAFEGGTSGTLNISAVLPNNVDKIVALASHNGLLIIFCERNIVVYGGAQDPLGSFALADVIAGVGCVARDSLQGTGNDLIFLSDTGVRSLGRLIQEKSLPMRDLTKNVRDDLLKELEQERYNVGDLSEVRSVYSELNAFYLLAFPSTSTVYCLDMRQALEDGSSRVTQWYSYQATSFLRRRDRELLIGKTNGIGRYHGYNDNGSAYRLRYFSHYLDMGAPTTNKILKQISATVIGGSNQDFVIKTNFDYKETPRSYPFRLFVSDVAEYGIATYVGYTEFKGVVADYASLPVSPSTDDAYMLSSDNSVYQWDGSSWLDVSSTWKTTFTVNAYSEFTFGIVLDAVKSSVGGSGNTIQIGFEANVNGAELSVQKIDMFVKTGRIS
jgi:hypothetical protein